MKVYISGTIEEKTEVNANLERIYSEHPDHILKPARLEGEYYRGRIDPPRRKKGTKMHYKNAENTNKL